MWPYTCWLSPVRHTRAKWQCVATRGQVGTVGLLALEGTMGGYPQAAGAGEPQWAPKCASMW